MAYNARPKATASNRGPDSHDRVRHDTVDKGRDASPCGVNGRMHHIGLGAEHRGTRVVSCSSHNLDAHVINPATGELIRALVIDPTKDYQPLSRPPGPPTPPTGKPETR